MSRSRSRLAADWFAKLTANAITGEVEGASVIKGTSLPSPISDEGTLFYDTVADALYVSKGTSWAILTNPPPVPTGGTVILITTTESAGTFDYNLGLDFTDGTDEDTALTYSLVSGTMPGGATLPTAGNTAFTGTATSVATDTIYTWVIGATDTAGGISTQAYQQQVNTVVPSATGGTVTITADGLAGFASSYGTSAQFTYATGSAESSYAISAGTLPIGLTLNTATGVISGTNGANASDATYTFTVRATDTDGDTVDQAYSWEIISSIPPTVTGGTVTIAAVKATKAASYDVDTNFTFAAGHTISAFTVVSGALPSGLSLNATTGVISGTMSAEATYSFTIRGTNTTGTSADQSYSWETLEAPMSATGGTITTYGIYKVHTFTSSGTLNVTQAGDADVLIVGGGGAGGPAMAGGGGGGAVYYRSALAMTPTNYSITIGGGGAGSNSGNASTGSSTSALGVVAIGGGGGSSHGAGSGSSGANGGGGESAVAGHSGSIASYSGWSKHGGHSGGHGWSSHAGGGGGGAGATGTAGGNSAGSSGIGGLGHANSSYNGSTLYWAAGGGGGTHGAGHGKPGAGGRGGGGGGGSYSGGGGAGGTQALNNGSSGHSGANTSHGGNAGAHTGSGGGGGGYHSTRGGSGASGIVIVRYVA